LLQQREQVANARRRATHDLRIADNTYETVEASYQLRNLMKDSAASFEALQKLEAPTFDQIFKNEELRREFENLTRKLDAPSSWASSPSPVRIAAVVGRCRRHPVAIRPDY